MRDLPIEISTQLAQRTGVSVRNFLWVKARNRLTGEIETMGLWNGEDTIDVVVNGQARRYHGAGSFVGFGMLKQSTGLNIRPLEAALSPISPELDVLLRQYDPKLAPVEVHQGFFSTETNNLIAPLQRVFKGWVNKMAIKTPPKGDSGTGRVDLVGNTRLLTKTSSVRRSNETQIMRRAGDLFFRHVSITGTVQTAWGSKTVMGGGTGSIGGGSQFGLAGMLNRGFQQ